MRKIKWITKEEAKKIWPEEKEPKKHGISMNEKTFEYDDKFKQDLIDYFFDLVCEIKSINQNLIEIKGELNAVQNIIKNI